ncbi:MerR family transcriptional regulator [Aquipuribacter sp. MA13-6]|uniref:MerR family transcriptional regulator n=1 Tax=unclassified Aquipuribacter TaxID=2635084 RepID=UPI003EEA0ED3
MEELNTGQSDRSFMQIGEVAALTSLSLRTIRHYEELGLVVPSGRTSGGFRLYAREDVDRLRLVRRMKPFFSLEETKEALEVLEAVSFVGDEPEQARLELLDRVQMYREAVLAQREALQEQVRQATAFAEELDEIMAQRESLSR